MYVPKTFEENRVEVLHDLIRTYPFGTMVTLNEEGLEANHIPFHLEPASEPFGTLYGHVARANPVWRDLSRNDQALVIFQGPQTYISTPDFIDSIIARARMLGKRIGVKYAEGFITEKKIGIKNLDALIQNET